MGLFEWINTVDTKGLGSTDLLFSSTLPSISLNPPSLSRSLMHRSALHFTDTGVESRTYENQSSQTCGGQFPEKGIMCVLKTEQGEGTPKRSTMQ